MVWPPNSPDMNPIEHLWAHLKLELHRRYPDTKYLRGSPDTIRWTLRARLTEVWWDIGEGVLRGLIDSIECRQCWKRRAGIRIIDAGMCVEFAIKGAGGNV